MATLIGANDSSPIEDVQNIKNACKGYLFSNFMFSYAPFMVHNI